MNEFFFGLLDVIKSMNGLEQLLVISFTAMMLAYLIKSLFFYFCVALHGWPATECCGNCCIDDDYDDDDEEDDEDDDI